MTAVLYTKAKQKFLEGGINLTAGTINASLVDTGLYTPNLSTNDFRDDIANDAVIATVALTSITVTDGVFNAANATFTSVPASANTIEAIVIWKDTGSQATSPLISFANTATGLPVTPNDGNITIVWDTGANKIFALT